MASDSASSSVPTTCGWMKNVHDRIATRRRQDRRVEQAAAVAVAEAPADQQQQAERDERIAGEVQRRRPSTGTGPRRSSRTSSTGGRRPRTRPGRWPSGPTAGAGRAGCRQTPMRATTTAERADDVVERALRRGCRSRGASGRRAPATPTAKYAAQRGTRGDGRQGRHGMDRYRADRSVRQRAAPAHGSTVPAISVAMVRRWMRRSRRCVPAASSYVEGRSALADRSGQWAQARAAPSSSAVRKLDPQPQAATAFGLLTVNPAPISVST